MKTEQTVPAARSPRSTARQIRETRTRQQEERQKRQQEKASPAKPVAVKTATPQTKAAPAKSTTPAKTVAPRRKPAQRPAFGQQTANRRPSKPRYAAKNTAQSTGNKAPHVPARAKHTPTKGAAQDEFRVIPLGGLEEIGANMMLIEYKRDIVVVDCGNQFPNENQHGIDYIIPNTKYLEGREKDIKGVVFTHGHLDHIGAAPIVVPKIGNPTMYASDLTSALIKKRWDEFKNNPKPNIQVVDKNSKINFGSIQVEFFHVTHSFPNALAVVIKTPAGNIVMTGDFRMDLTPQPDDTIDFSRMVEVANEGVTLLMSDSTGATRKGYSGSERTVSSELEDLFKQIEGRIVVATFSSLITRLQQIIHIADRLKRKVAVEGYSMRTNVEIAKKLGYIKAPEKIFISSQEANKLPDNRVLILTTGAQGEGNAALMRMATGEHRAIEIQKNDTVVLSSSVIPGNERTVQALKDNIYRRGAHIVNNEMMDIHASGHGYAEDLRLMISILKPTHFIPVHGTYHMMKTHSEIAQTTRISPKNTRIISNGQVIKANRNQINIDRKGIPAGYVMVDGLGVGDIGNVVLRDRQMMAEDGMFTIIVIIDGKKGEIVGSPDIISRGFIYMKESKEMMTEVRKKVKTVIETKLSKDHTSNFNYIKDNIRDKIGQYLFTQTQRRPMVLPVIIEV